MIKMETLVDELSKEDLNLTPALQIELRDQIIYYHKYDQNGMLLLSTHTYLSEVTCSQIATVIQELALTVQ